MKKTSLSVAVVAIIAIITSIGVSGCGKAKGKTLAKIGHTSITEGDLEALARVNPRLKPRLASPAGKQKVLENYVEQELLYQESMREGLNRDSDVKAKLALYQKVIVAQALLDKSLDAKIKEYYEGHKDEFERIKVSHIMIRTSAAESPMPGKKNVKPAVKHSEAEALKLAEAARQRLLKGEDFGKVAQSVSEDDRTKNGMGELGFVTLRDKRLERWGWLALAEKAFALKAGEISDVIKTKEGFHIVKVTEDKQVQPIEEADAALRFKLQADIRAQTIDELKKRYKVEYVNNEASAARATPAPESAPATPEAQPEAAPTGAQ